MAIRNGRTDIVSLLIEAGANIDLQNKVILVGECMAFLASGSEHTITVYICQSHPSLLPSARMRSEGTVFGSVCLSVCLSVSVCYSTSHFSSVCSSHKRYDLLNGQ